MKLVILGFFIEIYIYVCAQTELCWHEIIVICLLLFSLNIKWETDSMLQFLIKHLNTTNLLISMPWWMRRLMMPSPTCCFTIGLLMIYYKRFTWLAVRTSLDLTIAHHSKICMRGPKRLGNYFRKWVSPVKTRISLQQGSLGDLSSTCQPTQPNWPIRLWNIRSHWHWYPSPNSYTLTRLISFPPQTS